MRKSSLQVGVDVPWVTSWTEEQMLGVRACPSVGGLPAICQAEQAGYGRPQYSKNHFVRQRLSVRHMLCPMCGQATPAEDRWTQIAKRTSAGALRAAGTGAGLTAAIPDDRVVINAGSIAPLHQACVERSLAHCPHLKADPNVEVMAFPGKWVILPLTVEASPQPVAVHVLAAPQSSIPVIAFLQLCGVTDQTDRKWRRALRGHSLAG